MGLTDGAKLAATRAAGVSRAAAGKVGDLSKTTVVGYLRGLTYPFRGLKFVFFKHLSLARFWIPPILIVLISMTLLGWAGWHYHLQLANAMWSPPTDPGFWGGVARFFHGFVEWIVLFVLWGFAFLGVVFGANLVAAPFNDLLSEEVECLQGGKSGPSFSLGLLFKDGLRSVRVELGKLGIYLLIMVPLFVAAQLLPVVGHIAYAVGGFLFTTLYFAVDYVDWPATRRGYGFRRRAKLLKTHFMPLFGFGTGVWLFLFIPLVNLLLMPAAVAGGTLLFLELEGMAEPDQGEGGDDAQELPKPKVVAALGSETGGVESGTNSENAIKSES